MGLEHINMAAHDAARAKRRRELMLDDEPLHLTAWEPRRRVWWRVALLQAWYVLSVGFVAVAASWPWLQRWFARFVSEPCSERDADFVIAENVDGSFEVCSVEAVAERPRELLAGAARRTSARVQPRDIPPPRRMVVYRHTRYVFDAVSQAYVQLDPEAVTGAPIGGVGVGAVVGGSDAMVGDGGGAPGAVGLTAAQAAARVARFGRNVIDVPMPPTSVLLITEILHPFIFFQVWAVILWMTENYWTYAAFIFVTAMASAVANFWEVRKNLRDIRALSLFTTTVTAVRRLTPTAAAAPLPPSSSPLRDLLACDPRAVARQAVDSSALVPGDVIEVAQGMKLPADCVLLSGSCTVNEAMLTGESTVVIKAPLTAAAAAGSGEPAALNLNAAEARHTLFGGSVVVQLRVPPGRPVLAAVVRTGFDSVKGRLVLSILHPKSAHFKFLQQSLVFIGVLFCAALVGLAITWYYMITAGTEVGKVIQRGCDMVTIVVPPALPLALSVGVAYALVALRKGGVFCISPPRVNLAGKINCFCFDKTGTLTSEGLELSCIRPVAAAAPVSGGGGSSAPPRFADAVADPAGLSGAMTALLACCHSLTYIAASAQAAQQPHPPPGGATPPEAASQPPPSSPQLELSGDPLEIKTFRFTGATLSEPHHGGGGGGGGHAATTAAAPGAAASPPTPPPADFLSYISVPTPAAKGASTGYYVLRQFEFVPALQRMGVLVQPAGAAAAAAAPPQQLLSFVKGSPEVMASLCDAATLPADYASTLAQYTHLGYRVLAAGYRAVAPGDVAAASAASPSSSSSSDALRGLCEGGLTFLGFIVLENALKPETAGVIARLKDEAAMPVHMVTGDNPVSAVCIARQCGIVEPGWRVFIGDLADGPGAAHALGSSGSSSGIDAAKGTGVVWRDVDDEGSTLDPTTLLPPGAGGGAPTPGGSAHQRPYRLAMTGRAFAHLLAAHRAAVAAHAASAAADAAAAGKGAKAPPPPPAWPFHRAILNCAVFARMSPEGKAQLVEELQATGLYVGMCGDGANDALALRAAHVGVSLSQVEASVSAPFTSAAPHIGCIPLLLSQGRGALTTSFCLFDFMALYSTIQFSNAVYAVTVGSFLSNNEYLYQDLFMVFLLALTLGSTPAASRLTRKRPSGQLLSLRNLTLTTGFILLTFALQGVVYAATRAQPWYGTADYPTAMPEGTDAEGTNAAVPETTSVFLVAMYQYLAVAVIFSVGHPWKLPTWTNRPFCGWLAVVAVVSTGVMFMRDAGAYAWLGMQLPPAHWQGALFGYAMLSWALYAAFVGAVAAAHARGAFTAATRALLARPVKPHKRHRAEWAAVLSRMGGGGGGGGSAVLALPGSSSSASVATPGASPLLRAAGSAPTSAFEGAFPLSSPPGSKLLTSPPQSHVHARARRPLEDDLTGSQPPVLGGVPPPPPPVAVPHVYDYDFSDESRVSVPFAGADVTSAPGRGRGGGAAHLLPHAGSG